MTTGNGAFLPVNGFDFLMVRALLHPTTRSSSLAFDVGDTGRLCIAVGDPDGDGHAEIGVRTATGIIEVPPRAAVYDHYAVDVGK